MGVFLNEVLLPTALNVGDIASCDLAALRALDCLTTVAIRLDLLNVGDIMCCDLAATRARDCHTLMPIGLDLTDVGDIMYSDLAALRAQTAIPRLLSDSILATLVILGAATLLRHNSAHCEPVAGGNRPLRIVLRISNLLDVFIYSKDL